MALLHREVARTFKRVLGTFRSEWQYAGFDDPYMYATDGKLVLLYKASPYERVSYYSEQVSTLEDFDEALESREMFVRLSQHYPFDCRIDYIVMSDIWRIIGRSQIVDAMNDAKPATAYMLNWKQLAALGKPNEWTLFELPLNEKFPSVILAVKRLDPMMLAVSAPYRIDDASLYNARAAAVQIIQETYYGEGRNNG